MLKPRANLQRLEKLIQIIAKFSISSHQGIQLFINPTSPNLVHAPYNISEPMSLRRAPKFNKFK